MNLPTSIRLTPAAKEALEFLRGHPLPFILNQEVSALLVRLALERGWHERPKAPYAQRKERAMSCNSCLPPVPLLVTCGTCNSRLAECPKNEHGFPLADHIYTVGNRARNEMGHAMYFTYTGRIALCNAKKLKRRVEP